MKISKIFAIIGIALFCTAILIGSISIFASFKNLNNLSNNTKEIINSGHNLITQVADEQISYADKRLAEINDRTEQNQEVIASISKEKEAKKAENKPKEYSQGEKFSLGDIEYQISSVEKLIKVNGELMSSEIINNIPGGELVSIGNSSIYLLVIYKVKNEGNETKNLMSSKIVIEDSKGRKYSPSTDETTEFIISNDLSDSLFLMELNPGIEKNSLLIFELPRDILNDNLSLVVADAGFISSEFAKVKINQ